MGFDGFARLFIGVLYKVEHAPLGRVINCSNLRSDKLLKILPSLQAAEV